MIPLVKPYIAPREQMMPEIEKILYSGYIAEGQAVYDFEDNLKRFIGNDNLLAVQSGTAALHIAFSLLDIGCGDEVISTAMTAEPTNTTIALTGAKVVWGDVDEHTGLLDPNSVRNKITEKTKAIVPVHYAGVGCEMDVIMDVASRYKLYVIEDAAQGVMSTYKWTNSTKFLKNIIFQLLRTQHMDLGVNIMRKQLVLIRGLQFILFRQSNS